MRQIYLSPHPDDAALSAGGLIHEDTREGRAAEIWTIMSGVPSNEALSDFARGMHVKWSTTTARQTVELRREEDREAARILRARIVQLDFLDAIYRTGPDGTALYGDPVGAPLHPADAPLAALIGQALSAALRPEDTLVALLGIGDHVDHVIVRRAAEMTGHPVRYVADFPYVLQHPEGIEAKTRGLQPSRHEIPAAALAAWIEAVAAYRSQVSTVFDGLDLTDSIQGYARSSPGVRVWAPTGLDSPGKA